MTFFVSGPRPLHVAREAVVRDVKGGHHGHGLHDGDLDMLSLARPALMQHGAQYGHSRVPAGRQLGLVQRGLDGLLAEGPAQVHEPAHGLLDDLGAGEVTVGPLGAEGRDGGEHQPRIDITDPLVADAQALRLHGPVALHADIGPRKELVQDGAARGLLHIQGDALLVRVQKEEVGAALSWVGLVQEGRHAAGGVAARRLHLHDGCTLVSQHLGAEGPGDAAAKLHDLGAL